MFQVVQDVKGGKVKMMDVPVPACGDNEILVKVRASLISAGTEKMVMDFAEKSLLGKAQARPDLVQKVLQKMRKDGVAETVASVFARLDEPMPLGYSMAGEVVAVGTKLSAEFKIGDRVAGAGAGLANHADYVALPRNLTVPIPSGVPYEEACYATLGAIALHGVRNAAVGIGDRVLVVGLGLVGQLATQLAVAAGADVAALDMDVGRCDLAVQGGATAACTPADLSPISSIHAGRGFDAVLLCAATESDALMQQAADLARDRARVILVGKVGTRFDYASYMKKELTVGVSRSYGAGRYDPAFEQVGLSYPVGYVPHTERDNLAEVLRLMALGKVRPDVLTTHTFNFKNALEAYDMIKHKKAFLGIVLAYEETEGETEVLGGAAEVNGAATGVRVSRDEVGVGFLGVGSFARTVLLPTLVKVAGAHVVRLVSKGGLSAAGARDKFAKTALCSTDAGELWADEAVRGVVIATRHAAHARQVVAALSADKDVWVEKPLAMTMAELDEIEAAYAKAVAVRSADGDNPPVVMVGYNRRFSPFISRLKEAVDARVGSDGARQVVIRVNAGRIEGDNWQNTDEGGGRLIGEVCHFTDLAQYFCGDIKDASMMRGEGQESYAISLSHANGSVSQIVYASEGDSGFAKERVEVFAGGGVGVMDNYKTTFWQVDGKRRVLAKRRFWQRVDKGHRAALTEWIAALRGEATSLPTFRELIAGGRVILEMAHRG